MIFDVQSDQHLPFGIYNMLHIFMLSRYGEGEIFLTYFDRFRNHLDVVKEASGGIIIGDKLFNADLNNIMKNTGRSSPNMPTKMKVTDRELKSYLTVCFTLGAEKLRYWKYIEDLEYNFLIGGDEYPTTTNGVYKVISN